MWKQKIKNGRKIPKSNAGYRADEIGRLIQAYALYCGYEIERLIQAVAMK